MSTAAEVVAKLNAYEGINIWQDVILTLPGYDEAATDAMGDGGSVMFALAGGAVIAYDVQRKEWAEL